MVDVVNRTTKEYRKSVHTPDFPTADWIHNPDLSAVAGFANIYWTISGDTISLMDQAARDAVDAQLLEDVRDDNAQNDVDNAESTIRQVVQLLIRELNILRALHSLPDRTVAQARSQIRSDYGT